MVYISIYDGIKHRHFSHVAGIQKYEYRNGSYHSYLGVNCNLTVFGMENAF
jgi:hypothetical protein